MKSKKIIVIAICSVLIVLLIAFGSVLILSDVPAKELSFTGTVTVEDGVPNPASEVKEVTVEEEGKYYWCYSWMGDPGMITGMSIKGADGEGIFACTAEGCYAESIPMELKAGTYEVEIVYLTNDNAMKQFLTDNGIEEVGSNLYNYKENGTWTTEYMVGLEDTSNAVLIKMAFVIGLAIGLLAVVIILVASKKGDETKNQYDERQELVRGRGFKYGFFTIMLSNTVLLLMNVLEIPLFSRMEVAMTVSIIVGVGVFASYCIWNDGYFALNENRKKIMLSLAIIGVMNIIISIGNLLTGDIIENGMLNFRSLNIFCAMLFMETFVVLLIKHIKDGKEE